MTWVVECRTHDKKVVSLIPSDSDREKCLLWCSLSVLMLVLRYEVCVCVYMRVCVHVHACMCAGMHVCMHVLYALNFEP